MNPSRSLKSAGQNGSHLSIIIFDLVFIKVKFSSFVSPKEPNTIITFTLVFGQSNPKNKAVPYSGALTGSLLPVVA